LFSIKSSNDDLVLEAIRIKIPMMTFREIQKRKRPKNRMLISNKILVKLIAQKGEKPFCSRSDAINSFSFNRLIAFDLITKILFLNQIQFYT
jgi:hypothetical protein